MIKLKSIIQEIICESDGGSYEYNFSIDGEEILALSRETDKIEIFVEIQYSINPGSKGGQYEQPESPSVEIEGHEITNVVIHGDDGSEKEIDVDFLHPIPKKRMLDLVDEYIDKHQSEIEEKIMEGEH